ncbi:MAG: glycosyltransferase family 4 protein [Myxococcota bacterium]
MPRVLYISKPVAPPWNDSSKNLVRDLVTHLVRYEPRVLGRRDENGFRPPRGAVEPVYPPAGGGFAPGLRDNARVLRRLLSGPPADLWHFFFAPNPRSARAGRMAARFRRVPTVQTVCSAPRLDLSAAEVLFADRTVVLSRHTEARLLREGARPESLRRIPPALEPLAPPDASTRRRARTDLGLPAEVPLVVYPGDLEFGGGAERVLEAMAVPALRGAHLAMACRAKTDAAQRAETVIRERARELGIGDRVWWLGETAHIHALLGTADVVALPSVDLFAKMDYPLVLLEAMSLERPVVVARATPAEELAEGGAAVAVAPEPELVAHTLAQLLDDDTERHRIGRAARESVTRRFDPTKVAAAYEELYDELL